MSNLTNTSKSALPGAAQSRFLLLFWITSAALCLYSASALFRQAGEVVVAGFSICAVALVPLFIWCRGIVSGAPVFPLFSLTFIWSYGAQFLFYPEQVAELLNPALIWRTTGLICGFLVLSTVAWWLTSRYRAGHAPAKVLQVSEKNGATLCFGALALHILFTVLSNAGELVALKEFFSVARAIVNALGSFSVFCLAYSAGTGLLSAPLRALFWVMLVLLCAAAVATIFLINGLSIIFLAVVGFSLGRRRIAWMPLVVCLAVASLLHTGKAVMRERYWTEESQGNRLAPSQYPGFFAEWFHVGLTEMTTPKPQEEEAASLLERAGTLRLLLIAQVLSPDELPYLQGETYQIVPEMLVPRFLKPNKPTAHEGNTLLNTHYGLQTREDTERTTIGWGLFNEAYANFGLWGCFGLALVLGPFYGFITRWTAGMPLFSLRTFVALTVMALAVQSEFCASVYVSALFQGLVAVSLLSLLIMRAAPVTDSRERLV